MKTSDFDYHLPPELIAQHPVEPRDDSRLLVLDRASGRIEHSVFHRLGEYLKAGDLMALNDTRVDPRKASGESGRRREEGWSSFFCEGCRQGFGRGWGWPGRRLRPRRAVRGRCRRRGGGGAGESERTGTLTLGLSSEAGMEELGRDAAAALYSGSPLGNSERYQTVYAREPGSAGGPDGGTALYQRAYGGVGVSGGGSSVA